VFSRYPSGTRARKLGISYTLNPLYIAVSTGWVEGVRLLVGFDRKAFHEYGQVPYEGGHVSVLVWYLLTTSRVTRESVAMMLALVSDSRTKLVKDRSITFAMKIAIRKGFYPLVHHLCASGKLVTRQEEYPAYRSALQYAALVKNAVSVSILLM
jgi:hypothetical protein